MLELFIKKLKKETKATTTQFVVLFKIIISL